MEIIEQLGSIKTWCNVVIFFMVVGLVTTPLLPATNKRVTISTPQVAVSPCRSFESEIKESKVLLSYLVKR